jgi:IclR family acetate operon transcriptional repressor
LQLSSERDVASWIGDRLLEARTPNTAVTAADLHARLDQTRGRGYAIDDQENELGINCVAFPVYLSSPTSPAGAVSVSALAYRTPLPALLESVDEIRSFIAAATGIRERTA